MLMNFIKNLKKYLNFLSILIFFPMDEKWEYTID